MSLKAYAPILRPRLYVLLAAVTCSAVSAAAAFAWHTSPGASLPLTLQANSERERLETERVTIRPTGFDPAQITRPQGEFILAADNLSGLRDVTLILEQEDGRPVRERRVTLEQLKWRARVNLHPGRYVVREAGHPDWVCALTITPR